LGSYPLLSEYEHLYMLSALVQMQQMLEEQERKEREKAQESSAPPAWPSAIVYQPQRDVYVPRADSSTVQTTKVTPAQSYSYAVHTVKPSLSVWGAVRGMLRFLGECVVGVVALSTIPVVFGTAAAAVILCVVFPPLAFAVGTFLPNL
jgi:hypothetical protein